MNEEAREAMERWERWRGEVFSLFCLFLSYFYSFCAFLWQDVAGGRGRFRGLVDEWDWGTWCGVPKVSILKQSRPHVFFIESKEKKAVEREGGRLGDKLIERPPFILTTHLHAPCLFLPPQP